MAESSPALHAGPPLTQRIAVSPPWSPVAIAGALYFGLPLGSWLGGAFVEQVVGAVLR